MKRSTTISILLVGLLLSLAACNLPATEKYPPEPEGPATSLAPLVSAGMPTSCRSGPGPGYDALAILKSGQQAEAIGRSPQGDYWLVRNPTEPTTLCWVNAQDVSLVGNPQILPVATPPATPGQAGGPSPLASPTLVGGPGLSSGCPSPVPSGPTPVYCDPVVPPTGGCPSPVPSGPTPVYCGPAVPPPAGGCPSPVPSGPTPVYCGPAVPPPAGGCPSPVPSGPTPVYCGPSLSSGCPTPFGGGPTPVRCATPVK